MDSYKTPDGKGLLGKASLETLRGAVTQVIADYQKGVGRRPTTAEWEGLLTAALDRDEVGVLIGVTIALAEDDPNEPDDF